MNDDALTDGEREALDALLDQQVDAWWSRVPPRFRHATIDEVDDSTRASVEHWLAKPDSTLILTGPTGIGKTRLAYAIGAVFVRRDCQVVDWWVPRLLERLRPSDDRHIDVFAVADAQVLILDDLGAEKSSEWVAERLALVIDERWRWQRPTIVTTNYQPEGLRDDAVAVRLTGQDRRRSR